MYIHSCRKYAKSIEKSKWCIANIPSIYQNQLIEVWWGDCFSFKTINNAEYLKGKKILIIFFTNYTMGSLTYEKISENMLEMKVVQNFVVIILCFNHFNEKVCWTSQILGENSWKNVTFFCYDLCFKQQRRGADDQCIKTNKKMSHFFKNFFQGFVKFSKLFHWNG